MNRFITMKRRNEKMIGFKNPLSITFKCKCYIFILIFMSLFNGGELYSGKSYSTGTLNHITSSNAAAVFSTKNNTRVIAQKGGLAILPCAVKWNPSATVSWMRRRDFQLLTVGVQRHSSDSRFQVEHARHMAGHWSLRIKSVREEDKGFYECQLSIHPPQSIFVELKVVEAVAEIDGAPDLHIDEGSTLRLECKLKRATEKPNYIFWYHDNRMVNFDTQNGFSVSSISQNVGGHHHHTGTHSSSLISNSNGADTGSNYMHKLNVNTRSDINSNYNDNGDSNLSYLSSSSSSTLMVADGSSSSSTGPLSQLLLQQQHQHENHQPQIEKTSTSVQQQQQHQQQHQQPYQFQSTYLPYPETSVLTIKEVHLKHAGNYTCTPSNARAASITVHVLKGEKPAAMQHVNRSSIEDSNLVSSNTNQCKYESILIHLLILITILIHLCTVIQFR